MHIELIGCTSAGKTTLAGRIVQTARRMGRDAVVSDEFVLKQVRLNWIPGEFVRRRVVEAFALIFCLFAHRKHREFLRLAVRTSLRAPGSWLYRLHIARITLRRMGIYELIRRRPSPEQIVLADDDGVLQGVHTLFVHTLAAAEPRTTDVSKFVSVVPLPDVVAYLVQPESVLVERTLARGHNRIDDPSFETVQRFVRRAVTVFEELRRDPAVASRFLVIDGEKNTVMIPEDATGPLVEACQLIRAAVEPASEGGAVRSTYDGTSRVV